MSLLLKVIKGFDAGVEVALASGPTVFGSADDCDVVLDDSSLGEHAFRIDVSEAGLKVSVPPTAEPFEVKPYEIFAVGEMEFVIGDSSETWPELRRWQPAERSTDGKTEQRRFRGWRVTTFALSLMFACAVIAVSLSFRFGPKAFAWLKTSFRRDAAVTTAAPRMTLDEFARANGLSLAVGNNGTTVLRGNFKRRVDRIAALASAYEIDPALVSDVSDDETLKAGVDEILRTLTSGRVRVASAEGRRVTLTGRATDPGELLAVVSTICSDVSFAERVDDSGVVCSQRMSTETASVTSAAEPVVQAGLPSLPLVFASSGSGAERPLHRGGLKQFVAGLSTNPYPCLLLRDGSRAVVGAEIDGWTVKEITSEAVTLAANGDEFVWRP